MPRSIARLAKVSAEDLKQAVGRTPVELSHPSEWRLAKCVLRFPEVVVRILDDLYMHSLCEYLYELTTAFTDFYENCYCVEKDKQGGFGGCEGGGRVCVYVCARTRAHARVCIIIMSVCVSVC